MSIQVEYIGIDELIPYVNNSRTHTKDQISKVAASIKEFGFTNPVLIDKDDGIIAGHCRVLAAEKLKMTQVPCIRLGHLTDAQRKAYIIADNRLALDAGWNEELLKLELLDLRDDLNFDIGLIGFNTDELDRILNGEKVVQEDDFDVDAALDDGKEPITQPGDIWLLGNHRLMCGDSTDPGNIARLMNGRKADMVFTDPPYGMFLNADYSSMKSKLGTSFGERKMKGSKYDQVIGDNEDFKPELITSVLENFSYCKEIFLWGADYYSDFIPDRNSGSWVVWDKRLDESADKMYGSTFELCWSKARHKRMIARVKWAGVFGMEKEHDAKRQHPTQKPVLLVTWFFEYYSMRDKKVIADVYGGSGSTLIACELSDKECMMMELDQKYCDVIIARWEALTGAKATRSDS